MNQLVDAVDKAVAKNDYSTLARIFSSSNSGSESWQSIGPGEQRALASHLIQAAVNSTNFIPSAFDSEQMENVFMQALSHLPITVPNAADNTLRRQWFNFKLQKQQDYSGAARVLMGLRMQSSSNDNADDAGDNMVVGVDSHTSYDAIYHVPPAEQMDVYVQVAECFLACEENTEADAAVNKAGAFIDQIDKEKDAALLLRYWSAQARLLDAHRKFVPGSQRYHELSMQKTNVKVDADDLLTLYGMAATCAILAAQPRVVAPLVQDERLELLDSLPNFTTHATLLRKLHNQHIIRPDEYKAFEQTLAEHQRAVRGDGFTILEHGMIQHNMMAVSQLYQTIYLKDLQAILGVNSIQKAEQIAASMILDGSLPAGTMLNQVESLLEFPDETLPVKQEFNQAFHSFCVELNKVAETIVKGIASN